MKPKDRERLAADAQRRFEQATAALAAEGRFGGPQAWTSEMDMMEEATRLQKEAQAATRAAKKNPES